MKKIKRIEISDGQKGNLNVLTSLSSILDLISDGSQFNWAILPFFDPMGVHEQNAQKVSAEVRKQISERGFAIINWKDLQTLVNGVRQFFDLVLIGCKDPKNLQVYKNDDDIIESCDLVIKAFDTSWWEVSCKDEELMQKYLNTFKEIRVVNF